MDFSLDGLLVVLIFDDSVCWIWDMLGNCVFLFFFVRGEGIGFVRFFWDGRKFLLYVVVWKYGVGFVLVFDIIIWKLMILYKL